jgi:hypothetical protein
MSAIRLKYRDVQDLPSDHPLFKEFERQLKTENDVLEEAGSVIFGLEDEESLDYFNRYVAGDR